MQDKFCREYILTLNFAEAARRAGYSDKVANNSAKKFLENPIIKARLEELQAPTMARYEITAEKIIHELYRIATCDISQAFNEDGSMKLIHEMPEDVRRAIQAVEIDQLFEGFGKYRVQIGHTKRIKFWDKTKALELLAKHFKLLTDKIEHTGSVTLEQLVASSKKVEDE